MISAITSLLKLVLAMLALFAFAALAVIFISQCIRDAWLKWQLSSRRWKL